MSRTRTGRRMRGLGLGGGGVLCSYFRSITNVNVKICIGKHRLHVP